MKLPFTFMKLEVIFTLLATVFYIVGWIVVLSGFGWCTTSHKRSSTICDARVAAGVRAYILIVLGRILLILFLNMTNSKVKRRE